MLTWNHPIVHNQVLRRAKTSNGTLKINTLDVTRIVLPVPPLPDQVSLVELITGIEDKVDALVNELPFATAKRVGSGGSHDASDAREKSYEWMSNE